MMRVWRYVTQLRERRVERRNLRRLLRYMELTR